ncbi:hypothetical protein PWG15_13380 [Ensifer adhaerens]|uniref:hypothetical protein n=1 Tax=Ensifer adhaerens TaxID=106592 RepID=UPI0023A9BE2C|nr:hypothetical protein [Ensifer adhaerens]WDZ75603.1 hypothetical protein PWG15_13380 [Ensifer adhaerens]
MEALETTYASSRAPRAYRAWPTYGPYLLFQTVPWLLVATVLRSYVRVMPTGLALLGMMLVQFAVLIAFLLASQKMIELAKGSTSLARLSFREQLAFGWRVIWRFLLLFLLATCTANFAGVGEFLAARLWLGFDGIAFPWRQGLLQLWIAIIATMAFMFVVEKGQERAPRLLSVLREIALHRRHLMWALLFISLFLVIATFVQGQIAIMLAPVFDRPEVSRVRYLAYIALILAFSYIRLWGIVAILTYALRASYRRGSQMPEAE